MPSFQVTLTAANTNYDLLTLVRAIDANYVDVGTKIAVQVEDDAGAQIFRVGRDVNLSDTRYGGKYVCGDFPYVETREQLNAHLKGLFARCDTAGKKLNIDVSR